jgi:opacity protein-like surface antigen
MTAVSNYVTISHFLSKQTKGVRMLQRSLVVGLLSLGFAGSAMAVCGPYVGGSVGITANTASATMYGNFRGAPLSAFIGYDATINNQFYIAGELTGTLMTGEISNHGSVKTSYGYGGSILPGFMISDHTVAFTRLGIVQSHFPRVKSPVGSVSRNSNGAQVGLGLKTSLTQNIDLRGEYDYISYRDINSHGYKVKPRSDVATLSLIYLF